MTTRAAVQPAHASGVSDLRVRNPRRHKSEIAVKLFLSRKTIEAPLGRILAKLGVRSRTELTRLVIQNGLGKGGERNA